VNEQQVDRRIRRARDRGSPADRLLGERRAIERDK
jgi:hypothetical protein